MYINRTYSVSHMDMHTQIRAVVDVFMTASIDIWRLSISCGDQMGCYLTRSDFRTLEPRKAGKDSRTKTHQSADDSSDPTSDPRTVRVVHRVRTHDQYTMAESLTAEAQSSLCEEKRYGGSFPESAVSSTLT
jgi:hypothetical protein